MKEKEPEQKNEEVDLFLLFTGEKEEPKEQLPAPNRAVRAGDRCPRCGAGVMDYDGMLNLVCPKCQYTEGGCFT